jgi:hypothetical protein
MSMQRLKFYRHGIRFTILIFICVLQYGCGDYKIVNSREYEVVTKVDLAQLKKEAEIGRSVGRYQIFTRGVRTWRLDTATGRSCLLLTSDEDWKKPDTAASGCSNY